MREKKQQQDALPKYAAPVLLLADVRRKAEALDRYFFGVFIPSFRMNVTSFFLRDLHNVVRGVEK